MDASERPPFESHLQDEWARWLLHRRHGGDPEQARSMLEWLRPIRERVLEQATIRHGDTVLDVGTGDGLIAFGALDRVGASGTVIFSDISEDLLGHCRGLAETLDALNRCEFLRAAATDLSPLDDASVDVVTTRSVLIYVQDKARAFREFFRVLKPGGRLSLFEPVNRFMFPEPDGQLWGYDLTPVAELASKVHAVYDRFTEAEATLIDFDERDLVLLAEDAGFPEIRLLYEAEIAPRPLFATGSWDAWLHSSGNPLIPTLAEAMDEALTEAEQDVFAAHLRPLVERGETRQRQAVAYLVAVKRI
jgi:arsenite methyltransferase